MRKASKEIAPGSAEIDGQMSPQPPITGPFYTSASEVTPARIQGHYRPDESKRPATALTRTTGRSGGAASQVCLYSRTSGAGKRARRRFEPPTRLPGRPGGFAAVFGRRERVERLCVKAAILGQPAGLLLDRSLTTRTCSGRRPAELAAAVWNTCRLDFTPEKAVGMGRAIEKFAAKEAKARQESQGHRGKEGGRGKKTLGESAPKGFKKRDETKRTTAVAAAVAGMSRPTFVAADIVVDSGSGGGNDPWPLVSAGPHAAGQRSESPPVKLEKICRPWATFFQPTKPKHAGRQFYLPDAMGKGQNDPVIPPSVASRRSIRHRDG